MDAEPHGRNGMFPGPFPPLIRQWRRFQNRIMDSILIPVLARCAGNARGCSSLPRVVPNGHA